MDALTQSAELLRRSDDLGARSARARAADLKRRAAAAQRVPKNGQLIDAAARTQEAVMRSHGGDAAGRAVPLSPVMDGC